MKEQKEAVRKRNIVWFLIFYVVICIGSGLFALLFFRFYILGSLGISFVILGIVGIMGIRRRTSALKRTNPELYAAIRADTEKRIQERRASQVRFSDFPHWHWLIVLFVVVVILINMDIVGFFSSSAVLETVITIFIVLFIAYVSFYGRKIRKKKKGKVLSPNPNK